MKVFFVSMIVLFSIVVNAQKAKEAPIFSTKDGAIKGYDPVAYFISSQPTKGLKAISHSWNGATWYFTSEANKKLFADNPEKYAPQYGGYCAYGWAQGYAVKIEADAWAIVDGKLYLNYNKSVQKDWDKDRAGYIKKADDNFKRK
ncbi:MAG TPA: YHS domain-containing (seleno)protein [Saprospiraceae bacterium]|nr:YHS domain-containing (seleno)protein [Saprospiraceae bacterium]HMU03914.1 YHS domain-containing (seleno)protein [Saprospiraceae bacterium]